MTRIHIILLVNLLIFVKCQAQLLYRGIVVDSLTLAALPGAHIRIKSTETGTRTNDKGVFSIAAKPADTLVISMIGYNPLELPLLFEESGILIRLTEKVNMLKEVTVTASRITEITRTYRAPPKPLEASALGNPFDYFSKWQREKRKLQKVVDENNRTFVYVQVVNDPEVREQMMEEFNLTEPEFYELLAKFNKQSGNLVYSTDSRQIIGAIKNFIYQSTR
ncbi:MAG: carboxypeptidase-like regulatory domain-containing protein [Cyclobacteriaceae bacterium]|nr:carboxypeptidase-like regulatory domain-containing protein [Cyclobacteriaceae bacterium]